MKTIVTYISYAMSVWAVLTTVWILAAKNTGKDFDVSNLKNDVEGIKKEMITKYEIKDLTDSIGFYNYRMEQKMSEVIRGQNALRNSYANYLKRDKTLTLNDFTQFMNGIEWIISPNEDKRIIDTNNFKIKIRKKQ